MTPREKQKSYAASKSKKRRHKERIDIADKRFDPSDIRRLATLGPRAESAGQSMTHDDGGDVL